MAPRTALRAGPPQTRSLTGIPGDILIARRQRSVCVVCGITPITQNADTDAPLVCSGCEGSRPARRRFDTKKERERGIEHLDRLLKEE